MTQPTDRTPRTQRREASARRKRIGIAGVLALVLLVVGGFVVLNGGSAEPVAKAAPVTTTTTTLPLTPPATTALPPPAITATTNVDSLPVFAAPDGAQVVTSLSAKTEYLVPRTLLVTESQGDWLKALLPMRPNGSTGWVRKSDVTLSSSAYEIRVSLAENRLVLLKHGQEILSSDTVGGSNRTPTPPGTYYITDPVDLRSSPGGAYGAYALGISGYSEVLFEFNGGPGQLAIHGTNQPGLIGQNVSNGCIRVPNEVIVEIAEQVPLGTPVIIT